MLGDQRVHPAFRLSRLSCPSGPHLRKSVSSIAYDRRGERADHRSAPNTAHGPSCRARACLTGRPHRLCGATAACGVGPPRSDCYATFRIRSARRWAEPGGSPGAGAVRGTPDDRDRS